MNGPLAKVLTRTNDYAIQVLTHLPQDVNKINVIESLAMQYIHRFSHLIFHFRPVSISSKHLGRALASPTIGG